MLASTLIFRVSVTVELTSLACKVKLTLEAVQSAMMSAVILPSVLTMFEIVTPLDGLAEVTVTITLPLPPLSVTLAICELAAGEPCCRDKPVAATIAGVGVGVGVAVGIGVGVAIGVGVGEGVGGAFDMAAKFAV